MDFKLIGKLCELGVDFAPTAAGMTRSNVRGWPSIATSNKETMKKWFKEDGDCSLVAVAKRGRTAILDIDDKAACLATGLKQEWLQGSFGVATPSGGEHWYFRQDASLEGLRSVVNVHAIKGDRSSKKILELKIDRCSVAAPTAKREGQPCKADGAYTPITPLNGQLPAIHPDLLAWILAHAEAAKQHFSTEADTHWKFHPSFSVERFCEDNYSSEYLSGMLDERTFVIVPEECPVCGRANNGSTLGAGVTKFFFSGNSYGFACKACGVNARYEYEEKMDELYDDFDPWSQYMIYEHEDEELMAKKDEAFLKAVGIATQEGGTDTAPEAAKELGRDPLEFPEAGLYGALGRMAREIKMPLGLAYPALIAAYSAKVIEDVMADCRVNVYLCQVAPIGGGKNKSWERALQMLGMSEGTDYTMATPASDRGIQVLLGEQPPAKKGQPKIPGPRRMLLVTEEIEEIVKKGSIDKSGMFQTLCTLWDGNMKTFSDRSGKSTVNCRLSWVGGIPVNAKTPEKFASIFGEASTHGLLSRFLLGYSGVKWNYRKWEPRAPKMREEVIAPDQPIEEMPPDTGWQPPTSVRGFEPNAEALIESWDDPTDASGRAKYYLRKVAILTASANDESMVSTACAEAAIEFTDWQTELRKVFRPGIAENSLEAKCTERIIETLRRMDERGKTGSEGYINWKRVSHDNKWAETYGSQLVARVIKGLIDCELLESYAVEDECGKKKERDTKWVRVVKGGEKSGDGENGATKT